MSGSQKSGAPCQQVGVKKAVYPTKKWELKKQGPGCKVRLFAFMEGNCHEPVILYGQPGIL